VKLTGLAFFRFSSYIPEHVEIIASKVVRSPPWLCWPLRNICITNDHGYVPFDVSTSRSFPRSCLITVFVTGVTRQVPLVVQELIILPEHLNSNPGLCYSVFSLIGTTSSGIYYQLGDIYSICRWCWNVAIYEWKVHNEKIEIISFVVKFRS
jgi:hypothetical protein